MPIMKHTRFQYTFIVAPELRHSNVAISANQLQLMIDREKEHAGCKLGRLIAEHIGFDEQEDDDSFNNKRYVLDVVAFKSDKWWWFKKELRHLLVNALLGDKEIERVDDLINKFENPEVKSK